MLKLGCNCFNKQAKGMRGADRIICGTPCRRRRAKKGNAISSNYGSTARET
jgi:hypothetical protein